MRGQCFPAHPGARAGQPRGALFIAQAGPGRDLGWAGPVAVSHRRRGPAPAQAAGSPQAPGRSAERERSGLPLSFLGWGGGGPSSARPPLAQPLPHAGRRLPGPEGQQQVALCGCQPVTPGGVGTRAPSDSTLLLLPPFPRTQRGQHPPLPPPSSLPPPCADPAPAAGGAASPPSLGPGAEGTALGAGGLSLPCLEEPPSCLPLPPPKSPAAVPFVGGVGWLVGWFF